MRFDSLRRVARASTRRNQDIFKVISSWLITFSNISNPRPSQGTPCGPSAAPPWSLSVSIRHLPWSFWRVPRVCRRVPCLWNANLGNICMCRPRTLICTTMYDCYHGENRSRSCNEKLRRENLLQVSWREAAKLRRVAKTGQMKDLAGFDVISY